MVETRGIRADRGGFSYGEAEKWASALRVYLGSYVSGIFEVGPLPGVELFERLSRMAASVNGQPVPLSYDIRELPIGHEGRTVYSQRTGRIVVCLTEETYVGLEFNDGRSRMTLYHEVAHAFLHSNQVVRLATVDKEPALNRAVEHPVYMDTEWQADALAGALLMPAAGLSLLTPVGVSLPDLSIVQEQYGVSKTAAGVRLRIYRDYPLTQTARAAAATATLGG